jgi:hypothetical protein
MGDQDREKERQRLQNVYAAMGEGELQALADDAGTLTAEAIGALRAEISRRNLKIEVAGAEAEANEVEFQPRDLVTVRRFFSLAEAMLAKSALESAGVESFVMDDNTARMYTSTAVGCVRLQVNRADAEEASRFLELPTPENTDDDENVEDELDTNT